MISSISGCKSFHSDEFSHETGSCDNFSKSLNNNAITDLDKMDNCLCNNDSIFNSYLWTHFHDRSSNGYVTCKEKVIFIACNLYSTSW